LNFPQGTNFGSFVTKRVCLPLTFLLAAAGLQAASFTFDASSTALCPATGQTCSGTALFTIDNANQFTVTLSNDATSILSAGQLLTDLVFSVDGGTVTLKSSSGEFVDISSSGVPTTSGPGTLGYGFGSTGSNTYLLCVICGNGVKASPGVPPSQGIIDIQGSYATANSSITGNDPHNPFVESGATFTFTTTTALDTTGATNPFSNVFLSFGTDFGNEIPTNGGGGGTLGNPTPEPVSMLLTGAGLIGLATLTRRRQKKAGV
jgi:hypothetical protein